ncbi:MAG: amino acid adenylation domain-containing protein, partial [Acidobacteria bacterium]|nr:amino acid adenylation domain-containing protein [Acidobacteriota bacterium]
RWLIYAAVALAAGAPARCRALPPRDPVFPLSLLAAADEEDLLWRFEYRADLYDRTTVLRFARCLRAVLEQVLEDPSIPVASLSLLQPGQRHQVLFELNDTAVPTSSGTLLEEILAQARCRPRAVALRQGCRELSYGELAGGSLQLAAVLRDLGVGRESVVALALERSPEWVLGALATLLAGGAFLPLDPGEPEPRLRGMLEDGAPDLVLHQGSAPAALGGRRLLDLDCLPQAEPLDGPWPEAPEQLAYVLFTSGSTGRPKGAMNSRGALANRIRWMQRAYRLEPRDRVLQKTPLTFDVALWEVFWPLTAGARLLLAPPGAHRDPRQLVELISAEEVTVLHFVPSLLPAFLSQARRQGPGASRSLRLVVASGEALEGELASSFRRQMGTELRFENLYGPTEAAIDVTAYSVPGEVSAGAVPLGGAVDNTAIHLLDGRLQPVGLGIPGELFIGGVQLARGYRRDPRRTAERFLPDPFSPCGGRLYRSGDLVRRLSDGRLIFLRRLDGQVKVRGVRIELGEVEAVLVSHPGILEAAALLVSDRSGPEAADSPREGLRRFSGLAAGSDRPPRLVAFYVAAAAEEVSPAELRTFLRHRLPPAMEPQALIPLRELPRTASGKLDRSRL